MAKLATALLVSLALACSASSLESPSVAHKVAVSHPRRDNGGPSAESVGEYTNESAALGDLTARSTPSIIQDHGQWSLQGCFVDNSQRRIIATEVQGNLPLTVERCMGRCWQFQYTIAGIENGKDCYCAESLDITSLTVAHLDECKTTACAGDQNSACGGENRLLLYHHSSGALYSPGRERIGDWESRGCYTDLPHERTLPYQVFADGGMTIEKCTQICYDGGFEYSGVERASECYCGTSIENQARPAAGCDLACIGNGAQMCGGANRISVYHYEGHTLPKLQGLPTTGDTFRAPAVSWVYDGCHVDSMLDRVLSYSIEVEGGMTVEKCAGGCHMKNFIFAGVANGNECYCDNEHTAMPANGCETPCSGDPEQMCGGIDRIVIYHLEDAKKKEVSVPVPSSDDGDTTGWAFLTWLGHGCYVDSTKARIMSQIVTNEPMTVEHCLYLCQDVGFTVCAMEAGTECFGTTSLPASKFQADPDDCNTPCEGNPEQMCGGPERLTVMYYSHAN